MDGTHLHAASCPPSAKAEAPVRRPQMTGGGARTRRRTESISELDPSEWDAIAGDDILGTHGWLRLLEECATGAGRFLYLTIRHGRRLVGAAACQTNYTEPDRSSLDRMLYGRLAAVARGIGMGATPALIAGSRFGMSEPFLIDPSLQDADREEVAAELVRAILEESERAGATAVVRNVTAATPTAMLRRAAFRSSPEMPTAYLDIRWPTFAAYRSDLKRSHLATERAIRQERSRAKKLGLEISRVTDPTKVTAEMHELLDSHYRRLNGVPLPFGQSFLKQAVIRLGDRATLIVARDQAQLVGVNFGLRHAGCSRSMMVGIDPSRGRRTAAYFVLLNHSIQRAIEAGDHRVYYGRLQYDLKLRRGCSLAHTSLWVRGRSPAQRALIRSFIGMRTRKIRKDMAPYRRAAELNAAELGKGAAR